MSKETAKGTTKTCEKCGKPKPDVKWAPDVRQLLCNPCWFTTPPRHFPA